MVVPARYVDTIADPGAYASTQLPQFEKDALASVLSDAATVKTPGAPDGDSVQASTLSFPAATARNTPEFQRLVTAWSSAGDLPPPSDIFATAGVTWFAVTQSTPAITSELRPMPAQPSTRTPCRETALATPYVAAPIVPATWVPWPLQSSPVPAATPSRASYTSSARPPNSGCSVQIPVSMI